MVNKVTAHLVSVQKVELKKPRVNQLLSTGSVLRNRMYRCNVYVNWHPKREEPNKEEEEVRNRQRDDKEKEEQRKQSESERGQTVDLNIHH